MALICAFLNIRGGNSVPARRFYVFISLAANPVSIRIATVVFIDDVA